MRVAATRVARPGARRMGHTTRQYTRRPITVDIHSHFLPPGAWPDFAARHGGTGWPSTRVSGSLPPGTYGYGRTCDAMLTVDGADFRPVTSACWSASERLADLDTHHVNVQLISSTPILFQWQREGKVAADVAAWSNDAALEMCQPSNGRLRALCQVPLQDIDLACRELDRAMAAGEHTPAPEKPRAPP